MKKRNSIWIALLALLLTFAMVACNPEQPETQDPSTEAGTTQAPTEEEPTKEHQTTQGTTTDEGTTEDPGVLEENADYIIAFDATTIGNIASQDMAMMDLTFDAQQQAMKVTMLAAGRPNFILTYPSIPAFPLPFRESQAEPEWGCLHCQWPQSPDGPC